MNRELLPLQEKALADLRSSLGSGKRRPMVQAPTGFGKTVLAAAICEGAMLKSKRMIFTVPALELVDQTIEMFWSEGLRDIGVIQADHPEQDWSRQIQIASVQTLLRRSRQPQADIVVVDEAPPLV